MGNKEKHAKHQEKKVAKLEAQFRKEVALRTPQHGPASSGSSPGALPAPSPLHPASAAPRFEALPAAALHRITAFLPTPTAVLPVHLCRSTFQTMESDHFGQGKAVSAVVRLAAQRWSATHGGAPLPPCLSAGNWALAAVSEAEICAPGLVPTVAFAVVRHGRSVVHDAGTSSPGGSRTASRPRRDGPTAEASEWLVSVVRNGHMALSTRQTGCGRTLLHWALALNDRPLAVKLAGAAVASKHGFDPMVRDEQRRTFLHVAAAAGMAETTLSLLKYCSAAKLKQIAVAEDAKRRTPVQTAAQNHHSRLASTLRSALLPNPGNDDDDDDDDGDDEDDWWEEEEMAGAEEGSEAQKEQ